MSLLEKIFGAELGDGSDENFALRAQRRSVKLALWLIDDGGEIKNTAPVLESLERDGNAFYSLNPFDHLLLQRHRKIVRRLHEDPAFVTNKLKRSSVKHFPLNLQ
jgi:hypothetical protein